jgi:hypothetical protein
MNEKLNTAQPARDDGGPAFPSTGNIFANNGGMTKREWYAGQALAGLRSLQRDGKIMPSEEAAEKAFADADAMIKAGGA